jgi:hypothetical protein
MLEAGGTILVGRVGASTDIVSYISYVVRYKSCVQHKSSWHTSSSSKIVRGIAYAILKTCVPFQTARHVWIR